MASNCLVEGKRQEGGGYREKQAQVLMLLTRESRIRMEGADANTQKAGVVLPTTTRK